MQVREIMTPRVEAIGPDLSLSDCARKMRDLNIGALPVSDGNEPIGMVTDRDICCRAVAEGYDLAKTTAREIMTKDITWCFDDQDCKDAAHVMEDKHVRRLAVLNREKNMVGFLSVDDLARYSYGLAGEVLDAAAPRH